MVILPFADEGTADLLTKPPWGKEGEGCREAAWGKRNGFDVQVHDIMWSAAVPQGTLSHMRLNLPQSLKC